MLQGRKGKRIQLTERAKKRLLRITKYSCYPGPYQRTTEGYWDKDETFARNPGRGRASKYLKRCSNRKIRHDSSIYQGGHYRKVFDYWWELT